MLKFIHAADIHLDSPLNNLKPYDGAPTEDFRQCTRRAFENLIELAIVEKVAFVLISGDLYDQDWKDFSTGLYFQKQMGRLRDAGIGVFIIKGNHDAASQITRSLILPDNVRVLSSDQPESIRLDEIRVAIHGQSFSTPAIKKDLSRKYPKPLDGYYNIGMLHTCLSGREGHEPYAPCDLSRLINTGYDYWALGHVHQHEIIHENPYVIYAGSLQGRHIREVNPKGCVLVSVDDTHKTEIEFMPLDVIRWVHVRVDARDIDTPYDLRDRVEQQLKEIAGEHNGMPVAARILIEGETSISDEILSDVDQWINIIRGITVSSGTGCVWIEKIKFNLWMPAGDCQSMVTDGAIGEVFLILDEMKHNAETCQEISAELMELEKKLPPEMKHTSDGIKPGSPEWVFELLNQVQPGLIGRLLSREKRSYEN